MTDTQELTPTREAFEAWGMKEHGWVKAALNATWDVDMYRNVEFQKNYTAWKAALAEVNAKQVQALVDAATKVVKRWDSPLWNDKNRKPGDPYTHTADMINEMRIALQAFEKGTGNE